MPTGSTRIRLRPANTSRIPFWGQLAIGLFWLVYVAGMAWGDTMANDHHFLHWVFMAFSLVYIGYVLVNNAPVFGTQSYLEFTPGYMVHKNGLFRPKQVFAVENIASLELLASVMRVRLKDNELYALDLKEVKGKRRKMVFREQIRRFAVRYGIALVEPNPPRV
ncbi:hypothetical protein ACFQ48_08940 [Hymenobacter caeli]|uniref:PH domain-containing protein n=1 Tax=Hymenobacter caeli TaxID=2735894 RepID=A0ABX2FPD8_9BACT|nr:hypothetical protein [Hymenobacter caeli]NRT19015.1 hypothetical protein [Hymenobacter caeli]